MKTAVEIHSLITIFTYPFINGLAALLFFRASSFKAWNKPYLCFSFAASLAFFTSSYWLILHIQDKFGVLVFSKEIGRIFWYVQALAEYISIISYICGATLIYFASRPPRSEPSGKKVLGNES